jgi:hypothetical protein
MVVRFSLIPIKPVITMLHKHSLLIVVFGLLMSPCVAQLQ